jgi:hypothetical protein
MNSKKHTKRRLRALYQTQIPERIPDVWGKIKDLPLPTANNSTFNSDNAILVPTTQAHSFERRKFPSTQFAGVAAAVLILVAGTVFMFNALAPEIEPPLPPDTSLLQSQTTITTQNNAKAHATQSTQQTEKENQTTEKEVQSIESTNETGIPPQPTTALTSNTGIPPQPTTAPTSNTSIPPQPTTALTSNTGIPPQPTTATQSTTHPPTTSVTTITTVTNTPRTMSISVFAEYLRATNSYVPEEIILSHVGAYGSIIVFFDVTGTGIFERSWVEVGGYTFIVDNPLMYLYDFETSDFVTILQLYEMLSPEEFSDFYFKSMNEYNRIYNSDEFQRVVQGGGRVGR